MNLTLNFTWPFLTEVYRAIALLFTAFSFPAKIRHNMFYLRVSQPARPGLHSIKYWWSYPYPPAVVSKYLRSFFWEYNIVIFPKSFAEKFPFYFAKKSANFAHSTTCDYELWTVLRFGDFGHTRSGQKHQSTCTIMCRICAYENSPSSLLRILHEMNGAFLSLSIW